MEPKAERLERRLARKYDQSLAPPFLKVDLQNHINLNCFYSQPIVERRAIYFNRATSNTANLLDYMAHLQCVFVVCAKDYVMSQIFVSILLGQSYGIHLLILLSCSREKDEKVFQFFSIQCSVCFLSKESKPFLSSTEIKELFLIETSLHVRKVITSMCM